MNVPNSLTCARLLSIPFFLLAYFSQTKHAHFIAGGIFALSAMTDFLDGYLARRFSQQTTFGAFLDPVVDKLMIIAALLVVVHHYHHVGLTIAAYIIIIREIAVSALREWMACIGSRRNVDVRQIAKVKTVVQMLVVGVLIVKDIPINTVDWQVVITMLYAAVCLTIWSMILYLKAARVDLMDKAVV